MHSPLYFQYEGIVKPLPLNVHLLTLEKLDHTHHLLRLEHMAQSDEFPLNNTASVQLDVSHHYHNVYDIIIYRIFGNV